jgi:glycosyltransferase involved in cell wall biosynthesis
MTSLNIWWFSQYASTPDQQFTTQHDLAKKLVEKGHRVTFFAAGFSHYKFKEIRLKPGEEWREDECEGVRFIWIKTPPYRANDWKRAYNMGSFAWKAYRLARKLDEKPDVIIGTTFHPLSSLAAYESARSKRVPFIFEVKDLWPLTMVQFGKLSTKHPLAVVLGFLERFLARRATRIMTTLPSASDYYGELGVPKDKVVWIPNGLVLSRYETLKPYNGQISHPCKFVYAGGHVEAFPIDMILRAAQIEQEKDNDSHFLFVGGGQDKPKLMQLAKELKLQNVEFRDTVPKSELYRVMEQADAFMLTMRDLPGLYRYGISFNKLCDYVASGRPVLFAGNASNNVVKEYKCGIVVPPENPEAFAEAIREFRNLSNEERAEMGRNGIRCAKERFDISVLGDRLEQMLLSVADDSRGLPGASRGSSESRSASQNAGTTDAGSKYATAVAQ